MKAIKTTKYLKIVKNNLEINLMFETDQGLSDFSIFGKNYMYCWVRIQRFLILVSYLYN